MAQSTFRRRFPWWVAVLLVLAGAGLLALRGQWRPAESQRGSSPASPVAGLPAVPGDTAMSASQPAATQPAWPDLAALDGIRDDQLGGSYGDLLSKGFPIISNPRKAVLGHTAAQTLWETIADLGNDMSLGLSGLHVTGGNYMYADIMRWHRTTHHPKVLRVIEEGRRDPVGVSRALKTEIAKAMVGFQDLRINAASESLLAATGQGPRPASTLNDEYLKKHGRYKSKALEQIRRYELLYGAFYALANIGKWDCPELLGQWRTIQADASPMYDTRDIDVWLIDQYFQQGGAPESPEAIKHAELVGDVKISAGTTRRSRWNSPWDTQHMLLLAAKADVSEIPTIEVLDIPRAINLDEPTKSAIIQNFLEHTRSD